MGWLSPQPMVVELPYTEFDLGMVKEVLTDLCEVDSSQDGSEVEVPGDVPDDRLHHGLRVQSL